MEISLNVSRHSNRALHAVHLMQASITLKEIFHKSRKKNRASHLKDRLSVSDIFACIKHKPVSKRADKHCSVSWIGTVYLEESTGRTWKHKDETGRQPSYKWDDTADVWDEEGEDQGDNKPHQCLQDPPPLLAAHAYLHLFTLKTQPKSFYDCPAGTPHYSRLQWGNAPQIWHYERWEVYWIKIMLAILSVSAEKDNQ